MTVIRVGSITAPLDRPRLLGPAVDLVRRAAALGLLGRDREVDRLDLALVREIAEQASIAGVGRDAALGLLGPERSTERLASLIERLDDALVANPLPERELAVVVDVLGLDATARLANTSTVSLRRYLGGSRTAPDAVAERIHWLALAIGDLAGAYNDLGIRRWFERPRTALGGRSPAEVLAAGWLPDDPAVAAVRQLAAALAGTGTAT
jgi:hypothetical protein